MTVYYIVLAGLTGIGIPLCCIKPEKWKKGLYAGLVFAVLACLSAARYDVGIDYSLIYSPQYEQLLADPQGYSLFATRFEPGFVLLEKGIAFLTPNYQALFVATSILIVGLFMVWYYLYSPNMMVSVFLFITLSHWYCSMNFIRQTLAAAIALYAFPFLKKRKLLPYLGIVLLAALFHKSALLLIPFYFINLIPVNRYVLAAYAVVTAIIYFNTQRILEIVTKYWYQGYNEQSIHITTTFEWPFTIAALCGFLLVFLLSRYLMRRDKSHYVYVNYAFFALFFTLMGTRHSILDRLSLYFELTLPIAVAIILQELKESEPEERWSFLRRPAVFKSFCIALCAFIAVGSVVYHQYALTVDHHGVAPYQTIFSQPFYQEYVAQLRDPQPVIPSDEPGENAQDATPRSNPASLPESVPEGGPEPVSMDEFLATDKGE